MSSYYNEILEMLLPEILKLEEEGLITRTFRRLDPDRQLSILEAVVDELGEKGPNGFNIKVVAERAKVSIGSLYQYFGSRDNLMAFSLKIIVKSVTSMFEAGNPYLKEMPVGEALQLYLQEGLNWIEQQKGFAKFFSQIAYHDSPEFEYIVQSVSKTMRNMIAEIIKGGIERKEIREDINADAVINTIHALMIAITDPRLLPYLNRYFQLDYNNLTIKEMNRAAIDMILNGIVNNEG